MVEVEERRVGKMKIGLAMCAVSVVVLVVSNVWFHVTMQNQLDALSSELDTLNAVYENYVATHNVTDSEYFALKAAKLSVLSVYAVDVPNESCLHIIGELWNVGADTAYDCQLRVLIFREDLTTIDTFIRVGTIEGENRKILDYIVDYSGSNITGWDVQPEWKTEPEFPVSP